MSIELIAKVKPKNGGKFALMDAEDVEMPNGSRLSEQPMIVTMTQSEYTALEEAGEVDPTVIYMIARDGT